MCSEDQEADSNNAVTLYIVTMHEDKCSEG